MDNRNRALVVTRTGSEEAQKEKEKAKMERELQEVEDAVGFSSVMKKISESVGFINFIIHFNKHYDIVTF